MLFEHYTRGEMSRREIQQILGLGQNRFFALLKSFKNKAGDFRISYQRSSRTGFNTEIVTVIAKERKRE